MFDVEGVDAQGKHIERRDSIFGFRQPASEGKVWKILRQNLHNVEDLDAMFGLLQGDTNITSGRLAEIAKEFPILQQLVDAFAYTVKDGKVIPKKSKRERYVQFWETFKKHMNNFIKVEVNDVNGAKTYKTINQTKHETEQAIFENWKNKFLKSSLYDTQADRYDTGMLNVVTGRYARFAIDFLTAKQAGTLRTQKADLPASINYNDGVAKYKSDEAYAAAKNKIVELLNDVGVEIPLEV
ncbi:MAG: hypothetical protein HGA35_05580, partial [Erysipelotrichaceae bacterium]|nr:hypothetical protein [Erysipelotrichaceae bacterium]